MRDIFKVILFLLLLPLFGENSSWKVDFSDRSDEGKPQIPADWKIKKNISEKPTKFSIDEKEKTTFLCVRSDNSTGILICKLKKVDLTKTPVIRWKWRANELPENGDGRKKETDDQACGIYIGTGNIFNKKSVSYRWDTKTPIGTEGNISYLSTIHVKWFTLQNKNSGLGEWIIEERNIAEDFKKAWGFIPENIYLSVGGNSQYSQTKGSVDIDWIEFLAKPVNPKGT